MSIWQVFVEGWQFECCGDPFTVGDEVSWTLMLRDGPGEWPQEVLVELEPRPDHLAIVDERDGMVVAGGEIQAWWPGTPAAPNGARVRGALVEEHHGDAPPEVPPAHGVVRRIRLVTAPYARSAELGWRPASTHWALKELSSSPNRFASRLPDAGEFGEVETGMLVELDVTSPGAGVRPSATARVHDAELIANVRQEAAAGGGVEERAFRITELIVAATGRRWVGIYRLADGEVLNLAWSGVGPPAFPSFSVGHGLTGAAIRSRSIVISNDVASDPRYLTNQDSTGSELIAPVLVAGKVVGTLDVEEAEPGAFHEEDRVLFEALAVALRQLY